MRNLIVGIIIGIVVGVVVGTNIIAPKLQEAESARAADRAADSQGDAQSQPADPGQKPVIQTRWKMASAYSADTPGLGTLAERLVRNVQTASGGRHEIRIYEPDSVAPVMEMLDAVASGNIEAAFSSPNLWAETIPALALFGAIPFGPSAEDFLAWFHYGGGNTIYHRLYRSRNLQGIPCGMVGAGLGGWFRRAIVTLDDFKDLRIRSVGLASEVYTLLGADVRRLPYGDVRAALKLDVVSAADGTTPAADLKMGFNRVAGHYYLPAWQRPFMMLDLVVNKDAWEALTVPQRRRLENACGDNMAQGIAENASAQFAALKELEKRGAAIHRWPDQTMARFRSAWDGIALQHVNRDADFRDAWQSLIKFQENQAIWRDLAAGR